MIQTEKTGDKRLAIFGSLHDVRFYLGNSRKPSTFQNWSTLRPALHSGNDTALIIAAKSVTASDSVMISFYIAQRKLMCISALKLISVLSLRPFWSG